MADDIDTLLDEVEHKFLDKKARQCGKTLIVEGDVHVSASKTNLQTPYSRNKTASDRSSKRSLDDDIDDILGDECLNTPVMSVQSTSPRPSDRQNVSSQRKCFPVYLGDPSVPPGQANSLTRRACDRLRCTDCDFQVTAFDNRLWDKGTDYLFLRNNYPDASRLTARLRNQKGKKAYCCQCKWITVDNLVDLKTHSQIHWVCSGRH